MVTDKVMTDIKEISLRPPTKANMNKIFALRCDLWVFIGISKHGICWATLDKVSK